MRPEEGARPAAPGTDRVLGLIAAIEARLAALEAAAGVTEAPPKPEPVKQPEAIREAAPSMPAKSEPAPQTQQPAKREARERGPGG